MTANAIVLNCLLAGNLGTCGCFDLFASLHGTLSALGRGEEKLIFDVQSARNDRAADSEAEDSLGYRV